MILKNLFLFQILLLQVFISSCAYYNAQRDDVNSLITKWLTEQEFDKANKTLTQVKTTHPQYLELMLRKKEILTKSKQFVETTIKQANFFIQENKWEDAYTVYNFALNRISGDKNLNSSYEIYLQKRKIYITDLKFKLLISNAERLIKVLPVQRKIALAIKETFVEQNEFERLQIQARETVDSLVECSTDSLKLKKIEQAESCITFAFKLEPTDKLSNQLKKNQKEISQITAKKNQKKLQAESNSQSRTLKEYKAAFAKNDLYTAKKKLTILLAENKNNYQFTKLKLTLDESINEKIKKGVESGRILYSKGEIKLALDKWLILQKLDPDNIELNSHISRAERVLRKLHTLTNKDDSKDNGS